MQITEDWVKVVAGIIGILMVPVTAIVKVVSVAKDVEANKQSAENRMKAHEELCALQMATLENMNRQILHRFDRLEDQLDDLNRKV